VPPRSCRYPKGGLDRASSPTRTRNGYPFAAFGSVTLSPATPAARKPALFYVSHSQPVRVQPLSTSSIHFLSSPLSALSLSRLSSSTSFFRRAFSSRSCLVSCASHPSHRASLPSVDRALSTCHFPRNVFRFTPRLELPQRPSSAPRSDCSSTCFLSFASRRPY
jgi:hypothetical protein